MGQAGAVQQRKRAAGARRGIDVGRIHGGRINRAQPGRQQGKRLQLSWGSVELVLQPTAAGLLAVSQDEAAPDLQLRVAEASPLALAQTVLAGAKPPVEIQGDVQLAAEIGWLVDNLRWDVEEDLSRLFGDVLAHRIASAGRSLVQALRGFLQQAAARFPKAAP